MGQRPTRFTARAIEYAGLAALVGGAFLAVVLGGGAALGLAVPHATLTMVAAALLAVTFEPARRRLHRLANRLVYGHRRSPWEAVSHLAAQIGDERDPDDLLAELAGVVRAGTGASQAVVWLRDGATWLPAALSGTASAGPVGAAGDGLPRVEGADLTVPVRHGDELLGAVTVTKAGPGPLTPLERRLVVDLAAHAGIATTTLRLHQRLRRRLEVSRRQQQELIASRAQVIAAHDAERRRLERDIHDSCQQPAVVLAGRLGLAGAVAHRDPDQALAAVDTAYADLTRLAAALDRLVGAAPLPELAAAGIAAALRAETASLPVPVEVDDRTGGRRHRPEIEAEVYFCCTEAIQNATRHARPSRITVQLTEQHGWLTVRINDDGAGFDPDRAGTDRTGTDTDHAGTGAGLRNMRERLRRCGGRLAIRSSPAGTEVSAEIPAAAGGAGA